MVMGKLRSFINGIGHDLVHSGIFHPVLFSIYFVQVIFAANNLQLRTFYLVKPLAIVLLLTGLVFIIGYLLTKNRIISANFSSLFLILFFSYYPLANMAEKILSSLNLTTISKQTGSIIIFSVLLLLLVFLTIGLGKKRPEFNRFISIALSSSAIILVIFLVYAMVIKSGQQINMRSFSEEWKATLSQNNHCSAQNDNTQKRDVYFIILDGYASAESLTTYFDYDNRSFENQLKDLGFTIIPNGMANYNQTRTSVSSMLNMNYHDKIVDTVGENAVDTRPFEYMITDNLVASIFKQMGYQVISLPSGYSYTENIIADTYIRPGIYLTDFDEALLANTMLSPILGNQQYVLHANNINFALDKLKEIPENGKPKFVIAHIFSPHPPFVFDGDGNLKFPDYEFTEVDAERLVGMTSVEYYQKSYPMQLEYISKRILADITKIINSSDTKPIIILSGDHGTGSTTSEYATISEDQTERIHILDALYLPDYDVSQVPVDHTPVNTFRLILSNYFGCDYSMLQNKSFSSSYDQPYVFIEVPQP